MSPALVTSLIKKALPEASVHIDDLDGNGSHYAVRVVDKAFIGKSRILQHRLVYKALEGHIGDELHALSLQTAEPASDVGAQQS